MSFVSEATSRWPNARVIGDGRYAVSNPAGTLVYLAMDERQQRSIALGVDKPVLVDLVPTPCPDIADDYEDRQYERRQKRAEKFNAQY